MAYFSEEQHYRVLAEKDKLITELSRKLCYEQTACEIANREWSFWMATARELKAVLKLAAADYCQEQLEGLAAEVLPAVIIDSTIAQWHKRAKEGTA